MCWPTLYITSFPTTTNPSVSVCKNQECTSYQHSLGFHMHWHISIEHMTIWKWPSWWTDMRMLQKQYLLANAPGGPFEKCSMVCSCHWCVLSLPPKVRKVIPMVTATDSKTMAAWECLTIIVLCATVRLSLLLCTLPGMVNDALLPFGMYTDTAGESI